MAGKSPSTERLALTDRCGCDNFFTERPANRFKQLDVVDGLWEKRDGAVLQRALTGRGWITRADDDDGYAGGGSQQVQLFHHAEAVAGRQSDVEDHQVWTFL